MKEKNFNFFDDEEGEDTKNNKFTKGDSSKTLKANKLEEKLKANMFNVFCQLLKGQKMTPWKMYFLIAIEFIQFLQFSFHPTVRLN